MLTRNLIIQLCLFGVFSAAVPADEVFGLKITTETVKPRENTQYSFRYFVKDDKTGDYKTQEERKEGDSVLGSYTLADPNGDLRTVTYKAGPGTGFEAKVDVLSTGSPMKQTMEPMVNATEKPTAVESNVSHFPGGFQMNVSSKSDMKTEMEFSLKSSTIVENSATGIPEESSEISTEATEPYIGSTTENLDEITEENATVSAEVTEDPLEKEIYESLQLPKFPDIVLDDNKTHFKFHKDPEEALLDERITKIALQLAKTSLRREYEERKLGHFIPISVSSVEPSTTTYLPKSFRFMRNDATSQPIIPHTLAQVRVVPQYIYQQTLIPDIRAANHRLPVVLKPQTMTNPPSTIKREKTSTPIFGLREPEMSVMPIHVPTFSQFFTPYVIHTPGKKLEMTDVTKEQTLMYPRTPYSPATLFKTTEKP